MILTPHPTGAFVESHPFVPHRGLLVHLYQAFTGTVPTENDFNFFEVHQNGNVIMALRIATVGGLSRLYVVDALGGLRQAGADGIIVQATRHFFQVFFSNTEASNMQVWLDGSSIHKSGSALPDFDDATQLNFRDPVGGDLTAFLKNDTASPVGETTIHCAGLIIEHGSKLPRGDLPTDILTHGQTISVDIGNAEFDINGATPGPSLQAGTSLNFGDSDPSTRATFAVNTGGSWAVPESTSSNAAIIRMAGAYHWLLDIDADATEGPPSARLYFGSTKEAPSIPELAFVDVEDGEVSAAHHQIIVYRDLAPQPPAGNVQNMVQGFETIGVSGSSQIVGVREMYTVAAFHFPSPELSPLAAAASSPGNRRVNVDGKIMISLGLGNVRVLDAFGRCLECCQVGILTSGFTNCPDIHFDLTPFQGPGIHDPCSGQWRIYTLNDPPQVLDTGSVNEDGSLKNLPDQVDCLFSHTSFLELQLGCGIPPFVIWPGDA